MNPAYLPREKRQLGDLAPRIMQWGRMFGAAGLIATLIIGLFNPEGLFRSYLVAFCFYLSLVLGGIFFTLIHHLTRAGWSTAIRRLSEALGMNALLMALFAVPILLGLSKLYHWTHPGDDPLLNWKQPYLNVPFFVIRMGIYFAVWIAVSRFYYRSSVAQDATGDVSLTHRMQKFGPVSMIALGLTLTFAAFDLLMSLDPHWFSTIYGVYYFAGSVGAFFAIVIGMLLFLQSQGVLSESITTEHYHDLGKFMFAFIVFWAYIAYSQFMLIWYGNIPEETVWFQVRMEGVWGGVSLFLLLGHFVGPFLFIMSRKMKRRRGTLLAAVIWMLFMHWVDLYWLVKPSASATSLGFGVVDLTAFVGIGGLFVAQLASRLRECPLIPEKDPRLGESIAFENY